MDIYETRRTRLRQLVVASFGGQQVRLATAIDRQPDYVSRMLNGKKRIGEKLARIIESSADKPNGWLDTPTDNSPISYESKDLLDKLNTLDDDARAQVASFIEFLHAKAA